MNTPGIALPQRRLRATRLVGGAALLAAWLALQAPARAHVPHDLALLTEVSPAFAQDHMVVGVFQLTDHTLFGRSFDEGRSWQLYGLAMLSFVVTDIEFSPAFASDGTLFAATLSGGVYRSTDRGTHWTPMNSGLWDLHVESLAVSPAFSANGLLLAATPSGCFRSTNGGSWVLANAGLVTTSLTAVAFAGSAAFAAGTVIHRSQNGGQTWVPQMPFVHPVATIAVSPRFATDATLAVCFGRYEDGVFASQNGGAAWSPMVNGLTDPAVNDLAIGDDGTVFAATRVRCFRAAGVMQPWSPVASGFEVLSDQTSNHYLSVSLSPQFATDGKAFVAAFEGLFRSADAGDHWLQSDVYNQHLNRRIAFSPAFATDRRIVLGNYGGGPFFSVRGAAWAGPPFWNGTVAAGQPAVSGVAAPAESFVRVSSPSAVWEARANGIDNFGLFTDVLALSPSFATDRTLFAAYMGMYRSTNEGLSWTKVPFPAQIARALAFSPGFAADRTLFSGTTGDGVFRSTDAGDHWTLLSGGLPPNLAVTALETTPSFVQDRTVFLSSSNGGVWRTLNGGDSWVKKSSGLLGGNVRSLAVSPAWSSDKTVFAGLVVGGVFVSTNGGNSWNAANAGLPAGVPLIVEGIALSPAFATDRTAFVSLLDDGVYRSTDGGASWQPASTGLPLDAKRSLEISPAFATDRTLLLTSYDWVWMSVDAGESWWKLPGMIRVNEAHPTVSWGGTWTPYNTPGYHAQGCRVSAKAGDWTELTFHGDSIAWFSTALPGAGSADVYLDGVKVASLDLAAAGPGLSEPVFQRAFPLTGWHTIRIRNAGAQPGNPSNYIASDGFEYTF